MNPMHLSFHPFHLLAAFCLDILLGDPKWFPHPVKGIGFIITYGEKTTRRVFGNGYASGIVTTLFAIGLPWLAVKISLRAAAHIAPWCETMVDITWLYMGLSAHGLARAGKEIWASLQTGRMNDARSFLGEIVGRDTDKLDEGGISRATIESIAENTVDGMLSPLFFALLGGAPLMWLFKAVSTCDSMIGYKSERYLRFGALGARLDDAANFIPARLAAFLFPWAAWLCGESLAASWKVAQRDRKIHASPNAGIPEAAMAGALQVRLGGPAWYGGELEPKRFFGGEYGDPSSSHIRRAVRVMWAVSILFLVTGLAARLLWEACHG